MSSSHGKKAESDRPYTGRLAPSPTGALHLGNVRTFMIAYLRARSCGGKVILRIEDLDHPRDKPWGTAAAIEDLKWLGFDWDEVHIQSERREFYRAALARLRERCLAYPCVCSRRDVENAQSAPHDGEQLYYGGKCRHSFATWQVAALSLSATQRSPVWRFKVENDETIEFDDAFAGVYRRNVFRTIGDFPLARDKDGAGYTLAVTVDDALMGVTEVIRGDDLLPATPQQILVYRALGYEPPRFCHIPLVVGSDGKRLAKRHGDTKISSFRQMGLPPQRIIGALAHSCGWCECREEITLADLLPRFSLSAIPHARICVDSLGF